MLLSGCRSAYGGFAPRKKKRAKSCRVVGVRSVAKEDDATMRPRDSGSVIGALAVQDGAIFACKGHGLLSHKDGVTKEVLKDGTRENHGHTCQTCLDVFLQVSLSSQVNPHLPREDDVSRTLPANLGCHRPFPRRKLVF